MVAGAGVAALALARRRRAFAVAALVVVCADLAWAGIGYNPAIERAHAVQPATPAIRELQRAAPGRFVSTGDLPQNAIPMDYEVPEARGYDLPVEERFDRLWRAKLSPEFPSQVGPLPAFIPLSLPRVDEDRLRYLSLLGVTADRPAGDRAAAGRRGAAADPPGPRRPRLRQRRRAAAGARRRRAPARRRPVRGDHRARASTPGARCVVEEGADGGAPGPAGTARIVRTERQRLVVEARAERPGTLVVTDAWAPGWQARVDGRPVDVERVDYLFRGVPLAAGEHRVEFEYRPLSWRIGWIASLAALAALVAVLAWRR